MWVDLGRTHLPEVTVALIPLQLISSSAFSYDIKMEQTNTIVVRLGGACEYERPLVTFGRSSSPRVFYNCMYGLRGPHAGTGNRLW